MIAADCRAVQFQISSHISADSDFRFTQSMFLIRFFVNQLDPVFCRKNSIVPSGSKFITFGSSQKQIAAATQTSLLCHCSVFYAATRRDRIFNTAVLFSDKYFLAATKVVFSSTII